VKATEVTAGLAESNGSLLPGLWRDSLHVTCGLTACTPRSAQGPMLGNGNEYGKTLPLPLLFCAGCSDCGCELDTCSCHEIPGRVQGLSFTFRFTTQQSMYPLCGW